MSLLQKHMNLMIPLKMELPAYEINLVLEKEDEFAKLGITFEQFGTNTLLIRNIPVWIPSDLQSEYLMIYSLM